MSDNYLSTSQHQSASEETEENKKLLKIVTYVRFSSTSKVKRSQSLEKEKEGTFKNLGLVAAQSNDIAACAYSLKIFTTHTYITV